MDCTAVGQTTHLAARMEQMAMPGSPTDVQPVFAAVAASAARLCDAVDAVLWRVVADALPLVAHEGSIMSTKASPPTVRIGPGACAWLTSMTTRRTTSWHGRPASRRS
jgi:hypothetical protein